ncbi:MAG: beta-N-acetylglucosaminidase domain-containing protein [Clostridia bacterium]|nr:beta-N-acetylglucosaminidase domain-containing protein [Clostridia bacterium]
MIYPALQKSNIAQWVDFSPEKIVVSGFDSDFVTCRYTEKSCNNRKGDILYIDVAKENSRRTEYIDESRRLTDEKYLINAEKCDDGMHITLTVSCRKGLFRAMNRIMQMKRNGRFFIGSAEDYPLFAERGYIEGFYGSPWSFESRREMLKMMSFYGMNTHYYAPKDDPYHRDKWDELYPERELSELAELLGICNENFVDFYFCIAPGLSMKYSSETDFAKLTCKAEQLYSIGVRNFGLLLDDIPDNLYFDEDKTAFDGEAVNAHIAVSNKFHAFLKSLSNVCRLTVCPLQYHGRGDEYYISKLGKGLDSSIKIFWTGKNICSQELTVREAVVFENATNHMPLYWDNFPVNDAEMQNEMHLGYLNGREPDLYRYSHGIISNTMEYCLSSKIPLLTVCDYLWNPVAYDGFSSWHKACKIVFEDDYYKVMPFFDNLLISCLKVENSPMLNEALNDSQQKFFGGDIDGAKAVMADYIGRLSACVEYLETVENPVIAELGPWIEKQKIAYEMLVSATALLDDNSEEKKVQVRSLLKDYLDHPKTLCDFSLQAFAERMLTL